MKIAENKPYVFENNLIISISSNWIKVFKGIPKFSVTITKNKLVLESIDTIQDKKNPVDGEEVTS